MTDDTSRLYIHVKRWSEHQPRADRPNLPWIRLQTSLLGNDAWLELSAPDLKLLICVWLLTQRYGNGHLLADERWLKGQAKAHKSSLQRLVQAGFLTLSTTKGEPNGGLEENRGEKTPQGLLSSTPGKAGSLAAEAARRPTIQNGQHRKPSPTELDDSLRPLEADDEPKPLRDARGYLI